VARPEISNACPIQIALRGRGRTVRGLPQVAADHPSPSMAKNWQWILPEGERKPSCACAVAQTVDANRTDTAAVNNTCTISSPLGF
jgi:hypothetical protein